jgi:uncharacterized YccA/Bax inhibitor family protein
MRQIQSSNPAFNSKAFKEATKSSTADGAMTIAGTVNKTILLTLLVLASASYTWLNPSTTLMWVGIIGGLIAALVTSFKPNLSPISAPVYALLEGMALGGISLYISQSFGGGSIVFQAIASTIGVFFAMLFLYRTGIIKVNQSQQEVAIWNNGRNWRNCSYVHHQHGDGLFWRFFPEFAKHFTTNDWDQPGNCRSSGIQLIARL